MTIIENAQPNETLEPQLDWLLLRKLEHDEIRPITRADGTSSFLDLSQLGKSREDVEHLLSDSAKRGRQPTAPQKTQSDRAERYEVLAVGPGDWTDYSDEHGNRTFLRKPMSARVGDVVLVRRGAREVLVNSELLYLAQEFMCLARIKGGTGPGGESFGVMHDYIFAAPARLVAMSKGGIALPPMDEDFTGNMKFGDERYTALGVGEGAWCLQHSPGKAPGFARRPLPVEPDDTFCAHGVGFGVAVKGSVMVCLQAHQVAGVFR